MFIKIISTLYKRGINYPSLIKANSTEISQPKKKKIRISFAELKHHRPFLLEGEIDLNK